MKKLIVARHGEKEWGADTRLAEVGVRQITDLAEKLVLHVNGSSVLMLSSTAKRAVHSAEILAQRLNVQFETHDILWSGTPGGKVIGTKKDFEKVFELISSHPNQADVVVLVTHLEYAGGFPWFFSFKFFGKGLSAGRINKGDALMIDCETKTLTHIC